MVSRTELEKLTAELAEIFGEELANSLVHAARNKGRFDLDQQLLINDGLDTMTSEQRQHALTLIDSFLQHGEKAH